MRHRKGSRRSRGPGCYSLQRLLTRSNRQNNMALTAAVLASKDPVYHRGNTAGLPIRLSSSDDNTYCTIKVPLSREAEKEGLTRPLVWQTDQVHTDKRQLPRRRALGFTGPVKRLGIQRCRFSRLSSQHIRPKRNTGKPKCTRKCTPGHHIWITSCKIREK